MGFHQQSLREGADALHTLEIISHAQAAGFTLAEIRSLLSTSAPDVGWDRPRVLKALHEKAAAVDALQERLAQARRRLHKVIADIENRPENVSCTDNTERIMQQLRLEHDRSKQ